MEKSKNGTVTVYSKWFKVGETLVEVLYTVDRSNNNHVETFYTRWQNNPAALNSFNPEELSKDGKEPFFGNYGQEAKIFWRDFYKCFGKLWTDLTAYEMKARLESDMENNQFLPGGGYTWEQYFDQHANSPNRFKV